MQKPFNQTIPADYLSFLSAIDQTLIENESINYASPVILRHITQFFQSNFGLIITIRKKTLTIKHKFLVNEPTFDLECIFNRQLSDLSRKYLTTDVIQQLKYMISYKHNELIQEVLSEESLKSLESNSNHFHLLTQVILDNHKYLSFIIIDQPTESLTPSRQRLFAYIANKLNLGYQKYYQQSERIGVEHQLNDALNSNKKLFQEALKGKGIIHLCRTLEDIIHFPICLLDSFLYERFSSKSFTAYESFLDSTYIYNAYFTHSELTQQNDVGIFPIKVKKEILGFLLVQLGQSKMTDFIQMNIEHALSIIALEFVKEREIIDTERQSVGEIISDYISDREQNKFIERLDALGVNNQIPCYHITFSDVEKKDLDKILNIAYAESNRITYMPLLTLTGIIYFAKQGREEINHFINRMQSNLVRYSITPKIYIGRQVKNILEIDRSYKDTEKMLQTSMYKHQETLFYDDLTIESLFLSVPENEIIHFIEQTLKSLMTENSRHEILLDTIKTFFECHRKHKLTCQQLNIHINTLYYRLKVIEKELNIDLSSSDDSLTLYLAIKLLSAI